METTGEEMTHDELLERLSIEQGCPVGDALLAVVELHKPVKEDGKLWCRHESCYNHIEFLERNDCDCSYPCPTIQAIEKELS